MTLHPLDRPTSLRRVRIAVAALLTLAAGLAQAAIVTGQLSGWSESSVDTSIGAGGQHLTAYWSIASRDRGYFYGDHGDMVAFAAGVTDIAQITDASRFDYVGGYVGPLCDLQCSGLGVGHFVVWRSRDQQHYGVLRIDDIRGYVLDGTWWYRTDASGDFSGGTAQVPEPAGLVLAASALGALALTRRRRVSGR